MTTTDLATRDGDVTAGGGGALAIRADQTELTDAQRAALGHIGLAKAPQGDVQAFLHLCQRTRLDPWARQIYLIERSGRWTPQTGIDGFRVIAERNPEYAGQTPIEWCGDDGQWTDVWLDPKTPPTAARCGVKRRDRDEPTVATVLFTEFTAGNAKWKTSPAHMLGKCAEAGALRKAFPQDVAGLVTDDEAAAFEARGARARVTSQRVDDGPVDVGELTGTPTTVDAPPARTQRPAAKTASSGGEDRMTEPQQKKLFALIREAKLGDRNAWASAVLDRDITSFGQLTQGDAAALIDNAEGLVAAAQEDAEQGASAGADA